MLAMTLNSMQYIIATTRNEAGSNPENTKNYT
jgi:hypothetical protein